MRIGSSVTFCGFMASINALIEVELMSVAGSAGVCAAVENTNSSRAIHKAVLSIMDRSFGATVYHQGRSEGMLEADADFLFEIIPADHGGLLRRPGIVGHPIEFHDAPAAILHLRERGKYAGKVYFSPSQFHPGKRILRLGRHWTIHDVLQMKKQQPVMILFDRLRGVAAASH